MIDKQNYTKLIIFVVSILLALAIFSDFDSFLDGLIGIP